MEMALGPNLSSTVVGLFICFLVVVLWPPKAVDCLGRGGLLFGRLSQDFIQGDDHVQHTLVIAATSKATHDFNLESTFGVARPTSQSQEWQIFNRRRLHPAAKR